tara:strand:+ start:213 stop:665 length:453 start_codon:yes stop_codon:yes gene_type:complete
MKRLLLGVLILFLANCNGYQPILKTNTINYNINKIKNITQDINTNYLIRNLKSAIKNNDKENINLEISTNNFEEALSKDSKGDPLIIQISMNTKVVIKFKNKEDKIIEFKEKFSFNNQSDKFELEQYKKNVKNKLIDKIFQKLILKLRSL